MEVHCTIFSNFCMLKMFIIIQILHFVKRPHLGCYFSVGERSMGPRVRMPGLAFCQAWHLLPVGL